MIKTHTSWMILQFLQGPIGVNRAIKSSSVIDGSRLPTYLLYRMKIRIINNIFKIFKLLTMYVHSYFHQMWDPLLTSCLQ